MKRKRTVAVAPWLLAAALVAGLGWVWWSSRNPANLAIPPAKPTVQTNESTNPAAGAKPGPMGPAAGSQSMAERIPEAAKPTQTNSITPLAAQFPGTNLLESPTNFPRPVQNVFELQLALARQGLSPGSMDGSVGPQTRAALRSFQLKEGLPITGELDNATRRALVLTNPPLTTYPVSSNDLCRLQPLSPTWLGKSQQTALEYETLLELISEKGQSSPGLIRRLNPAVDWASVTVGTGIELPQVTLPPPAAPAACLTIQLADKVLEAWDDQTNLLAHFPCSIARLVEKRPIGELHVAVIARNPNYTFDPANFPESAEAQSLNRKLILPPGPNNPVGVLWIGLDKPGYGIHGTPKPEQVGRTESHGCFRLANWNAESLMPLVRIGTPVHIQP